MGTVMCVKEISFGGYRRLVMHMLYKCLRISLKRHTRARICARSPGPAPLPGASGPYPMHISAPRRLSVAVWRLHTALGKCGWVDVRAEQRAIEPDRRQQIRWRRRKGSRPAQKLQKKGRVWGRKLAHSCSDRRPISLGWAGKL